MAKWSEQANKDFAKCAKRLTPTQRSGVMKAISGWADSLKKEGTNDFPDPSSQHRFRVAAKKGEILSIRLKDPFE